MKTYTSLFLLLFIAVATAQENKIQSTIDEVTVYLTGAQVKRTASINVKPGTNEILLNDLSSNIDENSIQVSGLKNTSILSINFYINYLEKKENSSTLKSLKKELDQLLLKKNKLENLLSGLNQEKNLLDNNQRISSDNLELSLEKVKQISTYYRQRVVAIQNETYTVRLQINKLMESIKDLKNEISKLGDHTKEERGEIKLKLDAPDLTNLVLEIRYNVTNAGWFPLYDIKSKNIETPLNIAYKANVYQQTGTEWNDVKIILSTGDPNTNNLKPDLNPKYLNFSYGNRKNIRAVKQYAYKYNPTIRKITGIVRDENGLPLPGANVMEKGTANGVQTDINGRYSLDVQGGRELSISFIGFSNLILPIHSSTMNIKLEEDSHTLEEVVVSGYAVSSNVAGKPSSYQRREKKEDYNRVVETKEEGVTNTQFKIKKKYSIESSADITVIQIDKFDMKADYQYYVAPELNENVFLTAKLGNWEQFNLLAGEANIYFEGSYAGKTQIDPLATTDSLTISLGVDPNIIVKREQLNNFKSTSFTGSNKILNRGYKLSIKNNKQQKVYITLEDRIPISQNKTIKLDDIETSDSVYDSKTGIMKWKINISPNQKTEKQFSYQVKYPRYSRINL
ncbi:mucoidy inhibitor MuiA family protein [Aquimarina sp. 2201CG5-10]|uniref:mucoidy inhibitor MuiA family protein n=1 Tax=Aquimarina callyspongiae TaxID=3098150 RepID=UPI002AB3ED81|nr:mucoidy inhibitor MuiA family protein [Aquimarina sp. 2201CG5-10]MDY8135792.1 mucoidy inhibitor MuiA family protein [Aquimarina sp. 2201CG5-10]